jgi:hypothetical protein
MVAQLIGVEPVSEATQSTLNKTLAFAAVLEVGAGLLLLIDPAILVTPLLGLDISGSGVLLERWLGIALVALGLACWPGRWQGAIGGSPAFRAMLFYNVLIALCLAYLSAVRHLGGWLLWPAVALHACVALVLIWTWRDQGRTTANSAAPTRPA